MVQFRSKGKGKERKAYPIGAGKKRVPYGINRELAVEDDENEYSEEKYKECVQIEITGNYNCIIRLKEKTDCAISKFASSHECSIDDIMEIIFNNFDLNKLKENMENFKINFPPFYKWDEIKLFDILFNNVLKYIKDNNLDLNKIILNELNKMNKEDKEIMKNSFSYEFDKNKTLYDKIYPIVTSHHEGWIYINKYDSRRVRQVIHQLTWERSVLTTMKAQVINNQIYVYFLNIFVK